MENYKVKWKGISQPIGDDSWHSCRMYIVGCLKNGGCKKNDFEVSNKWGVLNVVDYNDEAFDPSLTKNYRKLF